MSDELTETTADESESGSEPESAFESESGSNCHRRSVLKATGLGAALPLFGGVATAGETSPRTDRDRRSPTTAAAAQQPTIDPQFGFAGTREDEVPEGLGPDETVELHVDEEKIRDPTAENPDLTVEFGAFHFDPVGLQVEPGAVVAFTFESPEHSVTAFHRDQDRQQRVPDDVPALSSPVVDDGGFWLYRFDVEGVYDLFCGPHEYGGMAMRVVVGDEPGAVVREQGRPPLPLTGALVGTGLPPEDPDVGHEKLAPLYVVENGPISIGDEPATDVLTLDLSVTVTAPEPV